MLHNRPKPYHTSLSPRAATGVSPLLPLSSLHLSWEAAPRHRHHSSSPSLLLAPVASLRSTWWRRRRPRAATSATVRATGPATAPRCRPSPPPPPPLATTSATSPLCPSLFARPPSPNLRAEAVVRFRTVLGHASAAASDPMVSRSLALSPSCSPQIFVDLGHNWRALNLCCPHSLYHSHRQRHSLVNG
jgi:hypothetical protein